MTTLTTPTSLHMGPWSLLGPAASQVRTAVFVHEQKIPAEMEWDVADQSAVHAVIYNAEGVPVATGRLLVHAPGVGRIGRMAVLSSLRGSGLGQQVLEALVQAARARGDAEVCLHAQTSAQGFYERLGFMPRGDVYAEVGIPHIEMVLSKKKTALPTLVFTLCTIASAFGGIMGLSILVITGTECGMDRAPAKPCGPMESLSLVLVPLYLWAWICYFRMGIAWVLGYRLPKWLPVSGTFSALSWFIPLLLTIDGAAEFFKAFGYFSVSVAPAMLLAVYLVAHHLRSPNTRLAKSGT